MIPTYRQLLIAAVTFSFAVASAEWQKPSVGPSSATPEKPFFSVSDFDVLHSRCRRNDPFTEQAMISWLDSRAQSNPENLNSTQNANVWGVQLVEESSYLIQLLQALLTNDKGSREPQKTYSSACHKVYCAAREIFGAKVSLQLLFMLARFGYNGSEQRVKDADAWKSEELDAVLLSLSDLPQHLISSHPVAFNHQLTHFKRWKDPTKPEEGQPIANAIIFLYDGWSHLTTSGQRSSVFHELGHDIGTTLDLQDSSAWYQAAGWTETEFDWKLSDPAAAISQYAEANPYEEFAESFAAFRYNPESLKEVSPKVYQFLKRKVFKNIEYTGDGAHCYLDREP